MGMIQMQFFACPDPKSDADAKKLKSELRHSPIVITVCDNARNRETCLHATATDFQANSANGVTRQINLPEAIAKAFFESRNCLGINGFQSLREKNACFTEV